jgi:hypothetical protein
LALTRLLSLLAVAFLSVGLGSACGAADPGAQPTAPPSVSPPAGQEPAGQKLDAALSSKLPQLPADQSVRLVVMLEPGVETDRMRDEITRLGGNLVERFTIIDAIVVEVPARNVLSLAAMPQVKAVELDDTGVPPPTTR